MAKYRKKPIVIEAEQISKCVVIETLEGNMTATPGDWIITGIKGERYPCKPEIFAATYTLVSDTPTRGVSGIVSCMKETNNLAQRLYQEGDEGRAKMLMGWYKAAMTELAELNEKATLQHPSGDVSELLIEMRELMKLSTWRPAAMWAKLDQLIGAFAELSAKGKQVDPLVKALERITSEFEKLLEYIDSKDLDEELGVTEVPHSEVHWAKQTLAAAKGEPENPEVPK